VVLRSVHLTGSSLCKVPSWEGVTFNLDGSLSYRDATTEEPAQRVKAVHEEVANGTFNPNRENDQQTRALGNKEHQGRTRGFGLIPWELSFPDDISTYRMPKNNWRCNV
jgi:hypothetical protein